MGDRKHDIERYLRGELSSAEMHALENEALNDPFLSEALEGIEHAGRENFLYDLHSIRHSVRDRVHSKSRKKGKVINIWGWTTAIAATVLLIVVSGFIVLSLLKQQAARQQALNSEPEPMPEEFAKKDTLIIMLPAETTRPSPPLRATKDRSATPVIPGDAAITEGIADVNADADETSPALTEAEPKAQVSGQQTQSAAKQVEGREQIAAKRSSDVTSGNADESVVVTGKVVDAHGQALPGVNVIIKGSNIGTVTDKEGLYQLSVPPGNRDVIFAFIGYEPQEIKVSDQQELNIVLKEDVAALSEVVVTGHRSRRDKPTTSTFRFAGPVGGRSDFKDYLATAVQYPPEALRNETEGRVTVKFTVQPDGALTDFEVVNGIGSGCEEALIEAIRSGPAWEPGMKGDRRVADQVKVRYRFKLPE